MQGGGGHLYGEGGGGFIFNRFNFQQPPRIKPETGGGGATPEVATPVSSESGSSSHMNSPLPVSRLHDLAVPTSWTELFLALLQPDERAPTVQLVSMKTPQQQNGYDCGVYVLAIAELQAAAFASAAAAVDADGLARELTPAAIGQRRAALLAELRELLVAVGATRQEREAIIVAEEEERAAAAAEAVAKMTPAERAAAINALGMH